MNRTGHPPRGVILPLIMVAASPLTVLAQEVQPPIPYLVPPEIFASDARPGSAVPSPENVLGYAIGERFTDHDGVVRYMKVLADASPVVEVRRYGTTVEGRPLLRVVVAREDRLARLDEVLARNRELADPATTTERAREIAAGTPAVAYLSYGVHGDESSSSEAALWTAWDLARGAASVAGVLDSLVVVMDPALNPDGRDRYVDWYRRARSRPANPDPAAREHHQPWPGGRYNHYLFDLNRDWAWATQPETRARLATWSYWTPQVHVDFHEMGWRSTYFFFPATEPINPLYPPHVLEWGQTFGRANAAAFDEHGWLYFTDETYDLFYPGYGDSWPSLLGAIGMTYEQAGGGAGGLMIQRPDGTTLTLRDRAMHHRVTGRATLRAAAAGKTELLLDFARFHRTIDEGLPDILLVPGRDPSRADALVATLGRQGIRVQRATHAFEAEAEAHRGFNERERFPAGTYLVRARQPRGRLAITLLKSEVHLNATFSYDISAWSLPYAYGVEAHAVGSAPSGGGWEGYSAPGETYGPVTTLLTAETAESAENGYVSSAWDRTALSPEGSEDYLVYGTGGPDVNSGPETSLRSPRSLRLTISQSAPNGLPAPKGGSVPKTQAAAYGYLVPPSFSAWSAMVRFLEAGGRAFVLDEAFALDGRDWPAGAIFLPRARNRTALPRLSRARGGAESGPETGPAPDPLAARIAAAGLAEHAVPVRTGLTDAGNDLGTEDAYRLALPQVAVLMGEGVSPTSYGAHWYFLERTLGLPFDPISTDRIGRVSLDDYDVLVMPDTRGGADEAALDRIGAWVRDGGTVVAVAGAAERVAGSFAGIQLREEDDEGADAPAGEASTGVSGDDEAAAEGARERALRGREARELERWRERIPGTILSVALDPAHPLAFGAGIGADRDRMFVLHRGGLIFEPDAAFETVAYFPDPLEAISGVISEENLDRLASGSWLVTKRLGGGRVILFADDPLFRHFWYAGFLPYTNALMIGPAM